MSAYGSINCVLHAEKTSRRVQQVKINDKSKTEKASLVRDDDNGGIHTRNSQKVFPVPVIRFSFVGGWQKQN